MTDAISVVDTWLDAIEAKDLKRIVDTLAEDVVIESELIRAPISGRQLLRDVLEDSLDAYASIRIERRKIIASGRDVAVLANLKARFAKDLTMYGEVLPTAGKSIDVVGAIFAEINKEGRISRIARVRDTLGVIQQLGISQQQITAMLERFEQQRRAA